MTLTGLPALDVAIGLAVLFFFLSTVCSSINEGIASVLGWRAKTLEDAIRSMLGELEVEKAVKGAAADAAQQAEQLTTRLFNHWRVAALVRDPASPRRRRNRPSYLPPRAFSRALAELIAILPEQPLTPGAASGEPAGPAGVAATGPAMVEASDQATAQATLWKQTDQEILERVRMGVADLPNAQVRALVDRAATEAVGTLDDFRDRLETAFNDAMERASGWYKRKVQIVLALIACAVAIGLNVDTVRIATRLGNDATLRAAVVARATATKQQPKDAATTVDQVTQLRLPVGWGANGPQGSHRQLKNLPLWVINRLPGWLLTIAALLLGAPFWFDLLSRFARLRGAGVPEKPRSLSDTAGAAGT